MTKRYLPYLIFIIAIIFRLFLLGSFPTGITNDELHFVLNAKSVYYSFTDLSGGGWSPLSLQTIPHETSSELPFLLSALFIGPFPLSLFYSKLFYLIISLATVFLLYSISKFIFNDQIALLAGIVAALNPWMIYVGRTAFDAPIALFFFLLFIYLLLILKNRLLLFSFIPAFIGFYSYIGTKVIFIPFVLITCIYVYKLRSSQRLLNYILIVIFAILTTLYYFQTLKSSDGSARLSELTTPNNFQIVTQSQLNKNLSLRSPFKPIYSSPIFIASKQILEKYLNNFSPDLLFLSGDRTFLISLWQHGYFYYIDLIFLLVGVYFMYRTFKYSFIYLLGLILISPIPEAIRIDKVPAYAFHAVLIYPILIIFIAAGIYYILTKLPRFTPIICLAYIFLLLNFIDIYFFRYPVYQSEGFFLSRRLVSKYLDLESRSGLPIYVLTSEPDSLFRNYLFYNNILTRQTLPLVSKTYQQNPSKETLIWQNITFTSNPKIIDPKAVIITEKNLSTTISQNQSFITITSLSDPTPIYKIYQSTVCTNISLEPFTHNLNITDFNIESLSPDYFCSHFITRN